MSGDEEVFGSLSEAAARLDPLASEAELVVSLVRVLDVAILPAVLALDGTPAVALHLALLGADGRARFADVVMPAAVAAKLRDEIGSAFEEATDEAVAHLTVCRWCEQRIWPSRTFVWLHGPTPGSRASCCNGTHVAEPRP